MVAYEMARLLTAQGQEVALLALFNTPSPGSLRWWPLNPNFLKRRILHELKKLPSGIGPKLRVIGTKSARLAGLTFGSFKGTLLGLFNISSPPGAGPLQQGILTVAEANIAAAKAYRPRNYAGRITLFLTREVATYYAIDPRAGWLPFVTGGIECHPVDGDNDCLFDPPFNKGLAERLTRCLEQASDRGRASIAMTQ
jgi:thioesterase domain-containing protein